MSDELLRVRVPDEQDDLEELNGDETGGQRPRRNTDGYKNS